MPTQPKLGVIIPYVQEWPQVAFTIRAIHEELQNIPHEIVAVDNFCPEVWEQLKERGDYPDRGHERQETSKKLCYPTFVKRFDVEKQHESSIAGAAKRAPWLTYVKYSDRLSHWQAKRVGCAATDAPILLFADSHVMPGAGSLSAMYLTYIEQYEELDGTLHAPLSYQILEDRKLIYKLVYENGLLGYSFTGYREPTEGFGPYEVPVMSTCGMMITRDLLEYIGGWPEELGIYGGGENFVNAALAVTGKKKWIMPGPALHHHGDRRGYHWNWLDHKRNQAIAMYLTGGPEAMWQYLEHLKPFKDKPDLFNALANDIMVSCDEHRSWIIARQVTTIEEWVEKWKE